MAVLSLPKCVCFIAAYLVFGSRGLALSSNQALGSPDSLLIVPSNASFSDTSSSNVAELCTSSLMWTGSTGKEAEFLGNCFQAWKSFLMTDYSKYKGTLFEFSLLGAPSAFPALEKMVTPRRYVQGESSIHLPCKTSLLTISSSDTCTIVIANIADIPRGILPKEPPGPFPRSDSARFDEIRNRMVAVRAGCLEERKEVGWAVSGK